MGQIKLLSPSVRIKKGRDSNFEILEIQIFTYYGKLDISPNQLQVRYSLVLEDFHMQDKAQHGALLIKFL